MNLEQNNIRIWIQDKPTDRDIFLWSFLPERGRDLLEIHRNNIRQYIEEISPRRVYKDIRDRAIRVFEYGYDPLLSEQTLSKSLLNLSQNWNKSRVQVYTEHRMDFTEPYPYLGSRRSDALISDGDDSLPIPRGVIPKQLHDVIHGASYSMLVLHPSRVRDLGPEVIIRTSLTAAAFQRVVAEVVAQQPATPIGAERYLPWVLSLSTHRAAARL